MVYVINGLGTVALARGDLDRAQDLFSRSIDICAEFGLGGSFRIHAETGRAEVLLARGNVVSARAQLEAILARESLTDSERPWVLARARFALARALAATGASADRQHAVELARSARDAYAEGGHQHDGERSRIASWIAALTDNAGD